MATQWIAGLVPVEAVIGAGRREVASVLVDEARRDGRTARLQQVAAARGIPVRRVPAGELERHAAGEQHGGILAQAGERQMQELDVLLTAEESPALFMLDGVEDPFNFGQAARTIYAAGATGQFVRPRNWLGADQIVLRASAGASEWLPAAVVETAEAAAAIAREYGLLVACATTQDALPLYDVDLTQPLLMVVGGEKRGITRSFARAADVRVAIPYGRPSIAYDLGTAAAATIIAYEMARQRLAAASRTDG